MIAMIPTRERHEFLLKALPKWAEQELEAVVLVCEARERTATRQFLSEQGFHDVEVISPRTSGQGIGYARRFCVNWAVTHGLHNHILMSDDDVWPDPKTDVRMLALPDHLLGAGMGAAFSNYGLLLGPPEGNRIIRKTDKPILVTGSWGYRLFSLRLSAVQELGNYDARLHAWGEDAEIVRDGIAKHGWMWRVHTGVKAGSIANRYSPGGLSATCGTPEKRTAMEQECHALLYKKWGDRYLSAPPKRFMFQWAKLLDDNVPNWRDLMKESHA